MTDTSQVPESTESTYIVIELPDQIELNEQCFQLTGLDTVHPVLEIAGVMYKGRYEDVLGTLLMFDKEEFDSTNGYRGKSSMRLIFDVKLNDDNDS